MEEQVVLVDPDDNPIGAAGKMDAHRSGALHRAISVFVFDSADRLLLQRRALSKYHSAGLWSNTCCSHPRPQEESASAARRRLREEMGIDCPLSERFGFVYRVEFDNGLIEHEYDRVYFGCYDGEPRPDPAEAMDWRWVEMPRLLEDLRRRPQRYSYWLAACIERVSLQIGSA